jgi:hypothetical protein
MPKINIYNRSGMGVLLQTGKTTSSGQWSGQTPPKKSLKVDSSTECNAAGPFGVTAAPVGAPTAGVNWRGTVSADTNLYIVAGQNNLEISLHDPS